MQFLYTTDLHGDPSRYDAIYKFAIENELKLIHLGADILPKGDGMLETQKKFIKKYLKDFYDKCSVAGIKVLTMFGNDDIYSRKKYFMSYGSLIDEVPETYEGLKFNGYPYVPDYPFGLVTACKYDHDGWVPELYLGKKVDVGAKGFYMIEDKIKYFKDKGTIEDDLKKFHADHETVTAIHCPPHALNMDVCLNGKRVGSKAVYDWIEREQPRLVLCGHIHESRLMTGTWKAKIGKTMVLQPGQMGSKTSAVLVELSAKKDRFTLLQL